MSSRLAWPARSPQSSKASDGLSPSNLGRRPHVSFLVRVRSYRYPPSIALLYGCCGSLISLFVPWVFVLPEVWVRRLGGPGATMLLGFIPGAIAGALYARLKFSTHEVRADRSEIWYTVAGHTIWGGKWEELKASRKGLRTYLTDGSGRRILVERLSMLPLDSDVKAQLSRVRSEVKPIAVSKNVFFVSLAILAISFPLAYVVGRAARIRSEAGEPPFWWLPVAELIVQLMAMGGFTGIVLGLPSVLSKNWRDRLSMGSKITAAEPVEMKPGIRYAYTHPEVLQKRMPSAKSTWLMMSPIILCPLGLLFAETAKGESLLGMALLLVAIMLLLAFFVARDSQKWHERAYDEFEVTSAGELLVYRTGTARRMTKVPRLPRVPQKSNWGSWYDVYEDSTGKYQLDRRYLVPKP